MSWKGDTTVVGHKGAGKGLTIQRQIYKALPRGSRIVTNVKQYIDGRLDTRAKPPIQRPGWAKIMWDDFRYKIPDGQIVELCDAEAVKEFWKYTPRGFPGKETQLYIDEASEYLEKDQEQMRSVIRQLRKGFVRTCLISQAVSLLNKKAVTLSQYGIVIHNLAQVYRIPVVDVCLWPFDTIRETHFLTQGGKFTYMSNESWGVDHRLYGTYDTDQTFRDLGLLDGDELAGASAYEENEMSWYWKIIIIGLLAAQGWGWWQSRNSPLLDALNGGSRAKAEAVATLAGGASGVSAAASLVSEATGDGVASSNVASAVHTLGGYRVLAGFKGVAKKAGRVAAVIDGQCVGVGEWCNAGLVTAITADAAICVDGSTTNVLVRL